MSSDFDFTAEYVLENDAVRLRPMLESDHEHLLPFALHEPDLWTYSLMPASGVSGLKKYIEKALALRAGELAYPFIVFDKRQNRYAGSTRFYHIDRKNRSTLLGYTWYGKQHQGTGLNKHCKFLLLEFAFEKMPFDRVELNADTRNARSIAAMKRIGCVEEGVLRSHRLLDDGQRRDTIVLSILRTEWLGGRKESLQAKLQY